MATFQVDDMTCGHCVSSVASAIRGVDPKASISIDQALLKYV